jgi:ABC-type sugar transport system ATPase subunit
MNTNHESFKAGFVGDTISNMGARIVQARVHDNIIRVCEDFHTQGRFVEALVKDSTVQNSTSHRIRALVVQVVLCQAASLHFRASRAKCDSIELDPHRLGGCTQARLLNFFGQN